MSKNQFIVLRVIQAVLRITPLVLIFYYLDHPRLISFIIIAIIAWIVSFIITFFIISKEPTNPLNDENN